MPKKVELGTAANNNESGIKSGFACYFGPRNECVQTLSAVTIGDCADPEVMVVKVSLIV